MSVPALSLIATFDDIRRCISVLTDGTAEEEFLRMLRLHDKFRQECVSQTQEALRIQKELDASLKSMADLETKLFHARRLLEMESKARREAENQRDIMEKKIEAVADMLKRERNLNEETKDQIASLSTLPRKRKSLSRHLEEKYGNDINSTGSFLSDLSITQSEDDFLDVHHSRTWYKHRPSIPNNEVPVVGTKRSRLSTGKANVAGATPTRRSVGRRSGVGVQQHSIDVAPGSERICATTKVTIPQDGNGAIRAESKIESMPLNEVVEVEQIGDGPAMRTRRSLVKQDTAPVSGNNLAVPEVLVNTPIHNLRPTLMRQHNFATKTFLRAESCMQCQKKIRFGAIGLRCRDCPVRCHVDCQRTLTMSCVPQSGTPVGKGLMGFIADYAPSVPPLIPALIVHCVNEIESRGLTEVGVYRVSGSEREVKALKERFLRGKSTPHLGNIDVHVLCGCIKDFLRALREPLIPTNLWKDFCNAVQNPSEEEIRRDLYKAINSLPQTNRDTLAFLILHFQRVAECRDVLMPIDNIARVFGPTIVGYSSADPDQHAIFSEVHIQYNVMLNLMKLSGDYWSQFVVLDTDGEKENEPQLKTPKRVESIYSIYATPFKSATKKRKFYNTPPYTTKK